MKIKLTGKLANNHYALVDDNFKSLPGKWSLSWNGYAMKNINGKCRTMQNWIMNTPKGMDTDHINRNKLDNRRENLRVCTRALNHQRSKLYKNNVSGFRGVQWYKQTKRWRSCVKYGDREVHLGYFKDLAGAIDAYNQKVIELFGNKAVLNIL